MCTYELLVAPLTPSERDQFCVEALDTGRLLGVPEEMLPRSIGELRDYLHRMLSSGQIVVGPAARTLASRLLSPPLGPAVHLFRLTRLFTVGLLPADIRDAYGFEWDARRARAFDRLVRLVRAFRRLLPVQLREWPVARAA
jgi:uncharacterized protein (DUF2236 family)